MFDMTFFGQKSPFLGVCFRLLLCLARPPRLVIATLRPKMTLYGCLSLRNHLTKMLNLGTATDPIVLTD